MPEYLSPGVYVEETSYRGKPIEGVSTSTSGFVGRTLFGREGRPTLVTSFTQFTREFGTPIQNPTAPGDYLGHAIRGFFENGGQRAYIVRVLGDGAQAAESTSATHGVIARLARDVTVLPGSDWLRLDSLRTIHAATPTPSTLIIHDDAGVVHSSPVAEVDVVRGRVRLQNPTPSGVTLRWQSTWILVDGVDPEPGEDPARIATFRAVDRGFAGNELRVRITPTDRPPIRITGNGSSRRAHPVVATVPAPGPSGGTASLDFGEDARLVRAGDTVLLSNGSVSGSATVQPFGALVTVPIAPDVTVAAGTFPVLVVQTAAGPLNTPYQITSLTGPFTTTGSVDLPHAAAALLRAGDVINIDGTDITVGAFTYPGTVAIAWVTGEDYSLLPADTEISVGDTLGHLLVEDATAFRAPDAPAEPVRIAGPDPAADRAIEVVDPIGRVLVLDAPLTAAEAEAWTSVESLLANDGSDTLRVASTGGLYSGASLEVRDGNGVTTYAVTAVDHDQRTVTLASSVPVITLPWDPADRAAYVRVQEIAIEVNRGGELLEQFTGLVWNPNTLTDSYPRYYVDRLNDPDIGSAFIRVEASAGPVGVDPQDQPMGASGQPIVMASGDDGAAPEDRHLIGEDNGPNARTGIEALKERDDISMVAAPGVTSEAVQGALITHCELMKYRVAVLDADRNDAQVTAVLAHRNAYDSSRAAYYTPWLETLDLTSGRTVDVPPCGHMMGIYARNDTTRGVHKAPANEVVRGVTGLKFTFTKGEQDVLNPEGVNVIREFERRGIRVWGARTLSSDSEWKYLSVRRLFNFLEASIDRGTQWVVFEPNNEKLWARVASSIASFLFEVWATNALMGTSPGEAFFVRCDRTTMTQGDLDNGRLICLIGVAPAYPAEFVIFRIGQFTANAPTA